jgi:hypothetical protein
MRIPSEELEISKATDEAIEQGLKNSDITWRRLAMERLYQICKIHQTFTMNDVRPYLKMLPVKTHDNRAVGGIVKTALKVGWLERTDQSIQSKVGHKSPLQVWKSMIYEGVDSMPAEEKILNLTSR